MFCICCNSNTKLLQYNNLMYCNSCYNTLLDVFLRYEEHIENTRKKIYSPPIHIIDNLYIGNIDSVNKEELINLGIQKIIIVGKRLKNNIHDNFEHIELLIDDSLEQDILEYLPKTNNFIDSNINNKILIHCYSGISRSVSILIGYIMYKYNINFNSAYDFVKNKYPIAYPNDNFVNQLKQLQTI